MMKSRQTSRDSRPGSESSGEDDERSPPRGRTGKHQTDAEKATEAEVDAQITALMDENSKASGA